MSNLDNTCEMLRRGNSESIKAFVEELNPTLCHFLSAFNPKPQEVCDMMRVLMSAFLEKLKNREKPLKNTKIHMLAGAINLIRDQQLAGEFLQKIRHLPYEEILVDSLPNSFFSDLNDPTIEYWEWFRKNQLPAPTKFLLDSLFIEGLKISEFTKLFQISDSILEPYVFTLFHRLSQEPELPENSEHELERFLSNLHHDLGDSNHSPESFTFRAKRLHKMFRIDIRKRLSAHDTAWILEQLAPDQNFKSKETPPENLSIIESIKKKNELEKLQSIEESQHEDSLYASSLATSKYASAKNPHEIFRIFQLAVLILVFFLGFSVYKTLSPDKSSASGTQNKSTNVAISLNSLQEKSLKPIGTYTDERGENQIRALETIDSGNNTLLVNLNSGNLVTISPFSKVRFHPLDRLEVIAGEVKMENKSEGYNFEIFSSDGIVVAEKAIMRFSKWYPTFSVAGVETGEGTVLHPFHDLLIRSGEEIILTSGGKPTLRELSSGSFEYPKFRLGSQRNFSNSPLPGMFNEIRDDTLNERLVERRKLEGQPTIKQKDFWDKL